MKKIDFGLEKLQLLNSTNTFYHPIPDNLLVVLKWFLYLELEPKFGGNIDESYVWAQISKKDGRKAHIYIDKDTIKDNWRIKAKYYKLADYVDSLNNQPMYEFESSQSFDNLGQLKEMIDNIKPEIVDGLLEIAK